MGRTVSAAPVWISPTRQFGRPCVNGTRVPVATIVTELRVGRSWSQIADDYGCDRDDVIGAAVVAALNPWMLPQTRWLRVAWEDWSDDHRDAWHHGRWGDIPEPPTDAEIRQEAES